VLAQVDEIIGVVKAEYFSFDGIEVFKAEIERLRAEYRVNPASSRLVVNMIGHTTLCTTPCASRRPRPFILQSRSMSQRAGRQRSFELWRRQLHNASTAEKETPGRHISGNG
jgi:hypothetical protein